MNVTYIYFSFCRDFVEAVRWADEAVFCVPFAGTVAVSDC